MVLKTHLEQFREPLKVPPVGQPKNPFSKSVLSFVPLILKHFPIPEPLNPRFDIKQIGKWTDGWAMHLLSGTLYRSP